MAIKKITDQEIRSLQIQGNLPNKPTQKSLYPDNTLTAEEVKAAFDKLPKLIAERYNELVSAIIGITNGELSGNSLASLIQTGIRNGHTLQDLFKDIANGNLGGGGQNGKSAYEIALENGFVGSKKEWLESLKGKSGVSIIGAVLERVSDDTPTLITFTIDGVTYQATSGMTWREWVNSVYNTGRYERFDTLLMDDHEFILKLNSGTVDVDSYIQQGAAYSMTPTDIIIPFAVDNVTYRAYKDSTWGDWITFINANRVDYDSPFEVQEPDGYIVSKSNTSERVYTQNSEVKQSDPIVSGGVYILSSK